MLRHGLCVLLLSATVVGSIHRASNSPWQPKMCVVGRLRGGGEDGSVWRACLDQNGRTYYYNKQTKVTSWKLPDGAVVEETGQAKRTSPQSSSEWRRAVDKQSGRPVRASIGRERKIFTSMLHIRFEKVYFGCLVHGQIEFLFLRMEAKQRPSCCPRHDCWSLSPSSMDIPCSQCPAHCPHHSQGPFQTLIRVCVSYPTHACISTHEFFFLTQFVTVQCNTFVSAVHPLHVQGFAPLCERIFVACSTITTRLRG
jgi:hypothetical protein